MYEKLKKLRLLASTNSKRFLEELRDFIQEWKTLKKGEKKKFEKDIRTLEKVGNDLFLNLYSKRADSNENVISAIEKGSKNVFDKGNLQLNTLKLREMLSLIQDDKTEKALKVMDGISSNVKSKGETILNTLLIGNNRANVVEKAIKNGVSKFRYEGPAGPLVREFCRLRVGKEFTIEEIKLMDNGQRLPVREFCGGYNCRHRWVAVIVDKEKVKPEDDYYDDDYYEDDDDYIYSELDQYFDDEVAYKLTGRIPGASVTWDRYTDGDMIKYEIEVEHEYFWVCKREIRIYSDDYIIMYNAHLRMEEDAPKGTNFAAMMLYEQVKACQEYGIGEINLNAFRSSEYNGYYTWARYGFDKRLSSYEINRLPDFLSNCKTIQDIMKTPEGRNWWSINGWSWDGSFDTSEDSDNFEILTNYLKMKGKI